MYGSKVIYLCANQQCTQKRTSKWDKKADMGILLDYGDVGYSPYRVLFNNIIIVASRHVDIAEDGVQCIQLNDNDENECSELQDENVKSEHDVTDEGEVEMKNQYARSSTRGRENCQINLMTIVFMKVKFMQIIVILIVQIILRRR